MLVVLLNTGPFTVMLPALLEAVILSVLLVMFVAVI